MHEIRFLQRSGTTPQDDVTNGIEFLKREGIAAGRANHHEVILVADTLWHRAFQLLVAENFDIF
jgi:hypothetical protein